MTTVAPASSSGVVEVGSEAEKVRQIVGVFDVRADQNNALHFGGQPRPDVEHRPTFGVRPDVVLREHGSSVAHATTALKPGTVGTEPPLGGGVNHDKDPHQPTTPGEQGEEGA